MESLTAEFPNLMTKEALARPGELSQHVNRSSVLAAIDYIVSLNSDVFIPSHGGNMGRAMQVRGLKLLRKLSCKQLGTDVHMDLHKTSLTMATCRFLLVSICVLMWQGHRAYIGHRKYIKPNKRAFISLLEEFSSLSDGELESVVRSMHSKCQGQPDARDKKRDRDVVAYPIPECMCKQPTRA